MGAARLSQRPMACANRGSNADARHCAKRRDNAYKIEELEVFYQWHPWFGRVIHIHEVIEQRAGGVLHCSLDGDGSRRWLELPKWMFRPRDMPGDPPGGLTACRYCGAHSLESVSSECVGCRLVRRPSTECLCFWCREELLQPESGSCPCDTSTGVHSAKGPLADRQGLRSGQSRRSLEEGQRE